MGQRVALSEIIRDSRVQSRESLNAAVIAEYAEEMAKQPVHAEYGLDVTPFPPITLYRERKDGHDFYWLADGWHRVLATEAAGYADIDADVRDGDVYDAIMYAAGSNARHGLKRSARDKRRAVLMLLEHPTVIREEWGNGRIAHCAGVSEFLVRTLRAERDAANGLPPRTHALGADGKSYSLQPRGAQPRTDTEPVVVDVDDASGADRTVLIYQCDNEGCDAVTTEPCWHCDACGSHLPVDEYLPSAPCPVCAGDEAEAVTPIATVEDRPMAPATDGPKREPYTPGLLGADAVTKAYERLLHGLTLIESVSEYAPEQIMAETPNVDALTDRIKAARSSLLALMTRTRMRAIK